MNAQALPENLQDPLNPSRNVDQNHSIINIEPSFPTLICPICSETYPQNQFFSFDACDHSFCNKCLREYLKENISSLRVLTIHCPQEGCHAILMTNEIQQILDKQAFDTYQKLALQKLIMSKGPERLCPFPGCARAYSISKKSCYTKCRCGGIICSTCGDQQHEGKSCLETLNSELKLYSIENQIKFCMVCKTPTELTEGCGYVVCPVCDYIWCWDCGRKFKRSHSCPSVWSPTPPTELKEKFWKENWAQSNIIIKILVTLVFFVLSPILFVGLVILWPFLILPLTRDLSKKRPFFSICKVFGWVLLGILVSPLILFGVFTLVGMVIVCFPCVIFGMYRDKIEIARNMAIYEQTHPNDQRIPTRRWIAEDPSAFRYRSK